jgi:transcriptional regulator with XRE-family HTH domain
MSSSKETQAFAQRLRQALEASSVRISPTVVANEFNLRYWGRSITPHTARNWLLGKSIPTQDKLRVLADWLQVGPDELRFGLATGAPKMAEDTGLAAAFNMADREMLSRYMALPVQDRKTVREVVAAMHLATQVRATS